MRELKHTFIGLVAILVLSATGMCAETADVDVNDVIAKTIQQEHQFTGKMRQYMPLNEIYVQKLRRNSEGVQIAGSDTYFFGRLDLRRGLNRVAFRGKKSGLLRLGMTFRPEGMAVMTPDEFNFNSETYDFHFVGYDALSEVRCLMFDVAAKTRTKQPRFVGRIWVEDEGYNIVRFQGTYSPSRATKFYFHFDAWRMNVAPGLWLPAYVYFDEPRYKFAVTQRISFRAQVRFWGYGLPYTDPVPTDGQYSDNELVARMERAGLVAPESDMTRSMNQIVKNVLDANHVLIPGVQCRMLMTSPLESFTMGHTIFVSRGLMDALPDEGALAAILANDLAQMIVSGSYNDHLRVDDKFLVADRNTFDRLQKFTHRAKGQEVQRKAAAMLENSPYQGQLANAALFLRVVQQRAPQLKNLISSRVAVANAAMSPDMLTAVSADDHQDWIAALPLGARVKVDPWTDRTDANKNDAALAAGSGKMLLEVSFIAPTLQRRASVDQPKGQ
jgi:hypothetical protein